MRARTIGRRLRAFRDEVTGVARLRRDQQRWRQAAIEQLGQRIDDHVDQRLAALLAPVNARSQPNINPLNPRIWNLDLLALNVKALGYELARTLGEGLDTVGPATPPATVLGSKLSTQADVESPWFAHWCRALGIRPFYHRKLWEFAWALQVLHVAGHLRPGARGLGFGCGTEPFASFFAARGLDVTITDLAADDARAAGWATNNEHAKGLLDAHHAHLVDRATFDARVRFRTVDMNAIPADLGGYDFCWSICALEHLGSLAAGTAFIENSLATLRPGGMAIHTTEFNLNPDGPTVDDWVTVFYQRRHVEALAERLRAQGHTVLALDFDPGDGPLDRFIDLPPWHDGTLGALVAGLGQGMHLKVAGDGFACTCIGIAVVKGAG